MVRIPVGTYPYIQTWREAYLEVSIKRFNYFFLVTVYDCARIDKLVELGQYK
jgi:hypothetical protein